MIARLPVWAIQRHDVMGRLAEAQLTTPGEKPFVAGLDVHAHHDPVAVLQDVVVHDAAAAGYPLLARHAVGVFTRDAAGEHGLPAGGSLADANLPVVAVGGRRSEEEDPASVGAFRRGVEVGVDRMVITPGHCRNLHAGFLAASASADAAFASGSADVRVLLPQQKTVPMPTLNRKATFIVRVSLCGRTAALTGRGK